MDRFHDIFEMVAEVCFFHKAPKSFMVMKLHALQGRAGAIRQNAELLALLAELSLRQGKIEYDMLILGPKYKLLKTKRKERLVASWWKPWSFTACGFLKARTWSIRDRPGVLSLGSQFCRSQYETQATDIHLVILRGLLL